MMSRIGLLGVLCFCLMGLSIAVPYDYMVYASIWHGTTCTFNACLKNETGNVNHNFFGIHGLWPDYWQGYPSWCDGNTTVFDPDFLGPTLNTMLTKYWSGMYDSSLLFHNHEWQKHGTCWNAVDPNANTATKMKSYFATVMEFAIYMNIYGVLEANRITPRDESYNLSAFTSLFDLYWKPNTYLLECVIDANMNQYLSAVYMCLDLNMKFIECPAGFATYFTPCTSNQIYYPPLLI